MEAKPGAVLSHSVPADGENIITSIAWNVRMSFFHSLERRNIAGDRLLRRRSEVLERGILVRPHRVSPEIPGFQRLLLPLRHASSRHRLASLLLRLPHRLGRRVAGRRVFFSEISRNSTRWRSTTRKSSWAREPVCGRTVGVNSCRHEVVLLESVWRDDDSFSFVDNLNRIVNVNLRLTSPRRHLQILPGHEVELREAFHTGRGEQHCVDERPADSDQRWRRWRNQGGREEETTCSYGTRRRTCRYSTSCRTWRR